MCHFDWKHTFVKHSMNNKQVVLASFQQWIQLLLGVCALGVATSPTGCQLLTPKSFIFWWSWNRNNQSRNSCQLYRPKCLYRSHMWLTLNLTSPKHSWPQKMSFSSPCRDSVNALPTTPQRPTGSLIGKIFESGVSDRSLSSSETEVYGESLIEIIRAWYDHS